MHDPVSVAEFIRVTYIETGLLTEQEVRGAGFAGILNGKEIDNARALKLANYFGRKPEFWLRMYRNNPGV